MFIFSSNYTKQKRKSPQEAETIMKEVALFYLVYLFFLENQG